MRRFAALVLLMCAAPASAQSMASILCEHTAVRAPLPSETFQLHLAGPTVESGGTSVPARVTDQSIEWRSGSTLYTLDLSNGMLIRVVLGEYATAWRCQPGS